MVAKISGGLWLVGTVLIVLSWVKVVPNHIGWVGWGIAMVGTLASFRRKQPKGPAGASARSTASTVVAELDTLSRQRDRGDITEEEYLRRKKALLGDS